MPKAGADCHGLWKAEMEIIVNAKKKVVMVKKENCPKNPPLPRS
jgi:hypothetical protein